MPRTIDWEIPNELQPKAEDSVFDLDDKLNGILGLQATVPDDAFTAPTLGTERAGSGVLIREDGLVLTIGYLITEAESIWLTSGVGGAVPATVLGYDQETGFGLVQALGRLNVPSIELGTGRRVGAGDKVVIAAEGGRRHAIAATVVARQEFAGHWEYLLDRAIFTAPAHPFWGGAGLIAADGMCSVRTGASCDAMSTWWCRSICCRRSLRTCSPMAGQTARRDLGSGSMPPRSKTRTRLSSPGCRSAVRRSTAD